jgi:hypothetical protein
LSRIPDLGKNFERLPDLLSEYDEHLALAPERIAIKGKIIEEALKEQAAWPVFYDEKRRELNTLVKYMDSRVNAIRGKLTRAYTENYSRELSDRLKDKYIDNETDFLSINEIYLEIYELAEKYEAVVEAFKVRGFALRDITTLRVNSLHDGTL